MPTGAVPLLVLLGALVAVGLVLAAIAVLVASRGRRPQAPEADPAAYPYESRPALFTPAERSFLGVLDQVVGDAYRVFGQARLADVITVSKGLTRGERQTAFNRIQSRHVDFVVRDPADLTPRFVVELDDRSHQNRIEQDAFLDQALAAAGLPLYRFEARRAYSLREVHQTLFAPTPPTPSHGGRS